MKYQLITGNSAEVLKTFPDNHFDSVVCDPPYLIDFLSKGWDRKDHDLTHVFKECLRVLKPGGHLIAFSAARTYHKIATMIEESGFEIRDQITWIYSSGFPKSQDVGRQLHKKANGKPDKQRFNKDELEVSYSAGGGSNGFARLEFGEAKPAKHAQTTLLRHKVTGKIYKALPDINGDRLAVSHEGQSYGTVYEEVIEVTDNEWSGWGTQLKPASEPICMARKPLKQTIAKNCLEWGTGALNIDAGRIPFQIDENKPVINKLTQWSGHSTQCGTYESGGYESEEPNDKGRFPSNVIGEIPDYQKYFYCPKVSRKERHLGFEDPGALFPGKDNGGNEARHILEAIQPGKIKTQGNNHPTVKPIALMDYLIKLVTKPGGKVLDPFNGSGSTGCAAVKAGYNYTGIDLDPNYIEISRKRIEAWCKEDTNFNELFENDDE